MATVVLVDTSIFLNVLNVPAFNQHRDSVPAELGRLTGQTTTSLLLPFASIMETGNHIAQVADGRLRRSFALEFSKQVQMAIDGEAPWTPTQGVEAGVLANWLGEFPEYAMREIGLGDLSIIKEYKAACERHPNHRVLIWSLDSHLMGYERAALAL
jgi:hypothetical protein